MPLSIHWYQAVKITFARTLGTWRKNCKHGEIGWLNKTKNPEKMCAICNHDMLS